MPIIIAAPNIAIFTISLLLIALCPFSHSAIWQISRMFVKISFHLWLLISCRLNHSCRLCRSFFGWLWWPLHSNGIQHSLTASGNALVVIPDSRRCDGHCVVDQHIQMFVFRIINICLCIVVAGLSQAALQLPEQYTAILDLLDNFKPIRNQCDYLLHCI